MQDCDCKRCCVKGIDLEGVTQTVTDPLNFLLDNCYSDRRLGRGKGAYGIT